jgi:hypothetical protein
MWHVESLERQFRADVLVYDVADMLPLNKTLAQKYVYAALCSWPVHTHTLSLQT